MGSSRVAPMSSHSHYETIMNRVKIRGARGPFCLSHTDTVLVPELRPPAQWLATIAPSQSLDVGNCNRISLAPKFRPTSPELVSECVVNSYTDCS